MTVRLSAELFERERELEQLDAALTAVLAGVGQVVVVQGSPGIGKSRLLDVQCARAEGSARVLRGRGGELERELPLAVVRELFEPAVGRADDAERSRLLAGAAGLAGPLLGVGSPESGAVDSAFAVMHGLYWLTANLADEGPLVLAVDDAHWTDEATQRWLAYLVPRISELPVLLAVAFRPRELDPASRLAAALAAAPEAMLVEPGVLGVESTGGMVADALGDVDLDFRDAVHRATGGNPLLVRTLMGALAANGVRPTASDAGRVQSVGIDRIGRIVLPRMHRLGRDAVEFARAAAVLGEGASAADARALTGLNELAAHAAADALVVAEVLRPDGSLGFVHPLVRAAVTNEVQPGARAELHRRAAAHLHAVGASAEDVSRHLLPTEPAGVPWALAALREAAGFAAQRGAPEVAIRYLERALREPSSDADRALLLQEIGWLAHWAGHPRALGWLERAAIEAPDANRKMRAQLDVLYVSGQKGPPRARKPVIALLGSVDRELELEAQAFLVADRWFRLKPASSAIDARADHGLAGTSRGERSYLAVEAATAIMRCEPADRVRELAVRGLVDHVPLADATACHFASAPNALVFAGALDEALSEWDRAVSDSVRLGSLVSHEGASVNRANVHLRLGNLAEAEADVWAALRSDSEYGFVLGLPWKLAVLTDLLRERGEFARAAAHLADHGVLDQEPPQHVFGLLLRESRARLLLAQGKLRPALDDFTFCGEQLDAAGYRSSAMFTWRAGVALCLAARGERIEAMRLAGEQLADARRFGAAPWLGSSLRALGKITRGEEGIAHLREAVEVLAASEARLEYSHALCDFGVLMRHERRPRDAREPLRRALDLAERCGATPLADRAAEELAAAGARPRRRAITGAASLTAAERRVASLAAQGKSNPEIAQSLFVTRKTVEKHLGNAYLKLQISSRGELATVLSAEG